MHCLYIIFLFQPNPENHIPAYRKSLEEFFGVQSHKKSIAMLLTPGMRVRIQVGFTPEDDKFKSSLILIRYSSFFLILSNITG